MTPDLAMNLAAIAAVVAIGTVLLSALSLAVASFRDGDVVPLVITSSLISFLVFAFVGISLASAGR